MGVPVDPYLTPYKGNATGPAEDAELRALTEPGNTRHLPLHSQPESAGGTSFVRWSWEAGDPLGEYTLHRTHPQADR